VAGPANSFSRIAADQCAERTGSFRAVCHSVQRRETAAEEREDARNPLPSLLINYPIYTQAARGSLKSVPGEQGVSPAVACLLAPPLGGTGADLQPAGGAQLA
jgi:hypothetical protein